MEKTLGKFLDTLKYVQNTKQLIAFLVLILVLILFVFISFGMTENGSYSLTVLLFCLVLVSIITILIMFVFISDNYFEYLKSKDWNKNTSDFLKSQDQTKTPAYIAASQVKYNEGKKFAYKHCLKEIDSVTNTGVSLSELKQRIKGAINSMEA